MLKEKFVMIKSPQIIKKQNIDLSKLKQLGISSLTQCDIYRYLGIDRSDHNFNKIKEQFHLNLDISDLHDDVKIMQAHKYIGFKKFVEQNLASPASIIYDIASQKMFSKQLAIMEWCHLHSDKSILNLNSNDFQDIISYVSKQYRQYEKCIYNHICKKSDNDDLVVNFYVANF